jgi:hypothetical protein
MAAPLRLTPSEGAPAGDIKDHWISLAVIAHRDALEEFTPERSVTERAACLLDLGWALALQGRRQEGFDGLTSAVETLREAVEITHTPPQRASALHTLGQVHEMFAEKGRVEALSAAEARYAQAVEVARQYDLNGGDGAIAEASLARVRERLAQLR